MTFRARGSTETFPTARQAAERALGTSTVIYIALDMFMNMDGKTCVIERV